jgi:hypothetical protein
MPASLDASTEQHDWSLDGHRITQLCVDAASCRLLTWTLEASLEIRLGVPFQLTLADGTTREIDPDAPEQTAPLLTLISREIQRLVVTRSGTLSVAMSDGSVLDVASHKHFEAFEVNGAGSLEGITYRAHIGGGQPWES